MGMTEKAMVVLSSLTAIEEGKTTIVEEGVIAALVEVIGDSTSVKGKEFAVVTLIQLCEGVNSTRNRALLAEKFSFEEQALLPLYLLMNAMRCLIPYAKEYQEKNYFNRSGTLVSDEEYLESKESFCNKEVCHCCLRSTISQVTCFHGQQELGTILSFVVFQFQIEHRILSSEPVYEVKVAPAKKSAPAAATKPAQAAKKDSISKEESDEEDDEDDSSDEDEKPAKSS
ncbi:hypothetical protein L2E82_03937 [Cichorium intybus]|uniref:Uncharacterized protein n=1 Tax=Cichorium intybus TaxID=13427 RepID=A0ACB9H4S6_CICIN|nr:hypothetical protein L2E82_03937 [Cichorium intybus]